MLKIASPTLPDDRPFFSTLLASQALPSFAYDRPEYLPEE